MLFQIRPIAVSAAVVCFFVIGMVGAAAGLSPGTCCKRAVLGAALAYVAGGLAARAIHAILTQAIIADQVRKEEPGENKG
ncbi:MAG: hypothetical protein MUC88_08005 [Planctomycetes bacterium]|jgi:hypothetical protein|nr:hypothetical protein [Planctomycetota bacterium]